MPGIGLLNISISSIRVISGLTILADGAIMYRKGLRGGFYIIDYSDDGGGTWEEIMSYMPDEDIIEINIDNGVTGYRHLVRAGAYVIDHVLTETGFSGTEGIDWEEIINING